MSPLAILALVAVVVGIALVIAGLFERQQAAAELSNMQARLERAARPHTVLSPSQLEPDAAEREFERWEHCGEQPWEQRRHVQRRVQRRIALLPTLSRLTQNNRWVARLEDELEQVRSPWRAAELIVLLVMLTMVVLIVCLLLGLWVWSFWIALPVLLLPRFYVRFQRRRLFRRFEEHLADVLLLMSNSLRAGFSFMQTMEMVAREAPSPIAEEFERVTSQVAVGVPVEEALGALGQRIKSVDVQLLLVAVLIQREVGGALAQLLETIATVVRERQRVKEEIRTLTAQGQLTGYVLGVLPFGVGAAIWFVGGAVAPGEPSFLDPLLSTPLGNMMLGAAFVSQIIGFCIIMRIVHIRV